MSFFLPSKLKQRGAIINELTIVHMPVVVSIHFRAHRTPSMDNLASYMRGVVTKEELGRGRTAIEIA